MKQKRVEKFVAILLVIVMLFSIVEPVYANEITKARWREEEKETYVEVCLGNDELDDEKDYKGIYLEKFYTQVKSISDTTVKLSETKYNYDGKSKKPTVTIKDGNKVLKKGTDYTITYSNNKKIGIATVTITGKGNYSGTITEEFSIIAKKGTSFESGSYKYKVTSSDTVAFTGIKKSKVSKTTKVKIADTVKYGGKTFMVTSIANKALYKKTKIKSVTIGTNIKKIGKQAFYGCKKLKSITIKSRQIKSVGKNALKGIYSKATIKMPNSKWTKYKKLFKGKGQGKNVLLTMQNTPQVIGVETDEYGGWYEYLTDDSGYYCIGEYKFFVSSFYHFNDEKKLFRATLADVGVGKVFELDRNEYNGRRFGIMHIMDEGNNHKNCSKANKKIASYVESLELIVEYNSPASIGSGYYVGKKNGVSLHYDWIGNYYSEEELWEFYEKYPEYNPFASW